MIRATTALQKSGIRSRLSLALIEMQRRKTVLKEFKEFAMRGNVMDLAVGVIIGAAFGKIISSLVEDVIMPPIGKLLGHVNFSDLYINLIGKSYESLVGAKKYGAAMQK